MSWIWRVLVSLAALVVPRSRRARYREQWLADLEGAPEVGLGRFRVLLGVLRSIPSITSITPDKGVLMPIGPLAIALKRSHATAGKVAVLAVLAGAALLIGVGVLVA